MALNVLPKSTANITTIQEVDISLQTNVKKRPNKTMAVNVSTFFFSFRSLWKLSAEYNYDTQMVD